jgi:hypothetical protein
MFRTIHTIYRDYFLNIKRLVSSVRYGLSLYDKMQINKHLGSYAMAQAVSLRPYRGGQVRCLANSCEICSGKRGTRQNFRRILHGSQIIPTMLGIRPYLITNLTSRTSGRGLRTFNIAMLRRVLESNGQKSIRAHCILLVLKGLLL